MIRHLKRPNIVSVIAHWGAAWVMILALYFGLSAVYGNGSRQETFAAHAYAGLTVLGLVVIRLFLRTLLPWPKDESGGSRITKLVAEAMHWTLYALMLLTPLTGWIVASEMGCCMTVRILAFSAPAFPSAVRSARRRRTTFTFSLSGRFLR
jgi:cytochrome b561